MTPSLRPPPTRKPRRCWLQFSLRTMLVLVLVCSIPCAWVACKVKQAREQRDAVEAIQKAGGQVSYDYGRADASRTNSLQDLLGRDFFFDVSGVYLNGTGVSAELLREAREDGQTSQLRYFEAHMTDDELAVLKKLPHIKDLTLCNTKVTDAGLANLTDLRQLSRLHLIGGFSDTGLEHVERLPRLRELSLRGTRVTDDGLKRLLGFGRLQHLDLSRTQVTDAGLQHLERFTELQHLDLSDTRVTDTGLEHLTQLKELRTLDLHDTKVTDAGLRHLNCLRELGELWLEGTRTTDSGMSELRKTLPRALIHR
jgi:Leucine-rich repeat (LRR) protein